MVSPAKSARDLFALFLNTISIVFGQQVLGHLPRWLCGSVLKFRDLSPILETSFPGAVGLIDWTLLSRGRAAAKDRSEMVTGTTFRAVVNFILPVDLYSV